ncbi:MAG: NAD-binding protein, partial [Brevundimonas sp.]|nr:NAD-binding protein [Brevundimonas sp.]
GHVTGGSLGLVTLVGLITIAASTYMITYSHRLYPLCEPLLRFVKVHRRGSAVHAERVEGDGPDVIVFGLGRYGGAVGAGLEAAGRRVLGVDINPRAVRNWRDRGHEGVFGDVADPEFLATLPLDSAEWVVATIRPAEAGVSHADPRLVLLHQLRAMGYSGRVAVTSTDQTPDEYMLEEGADLVATPFTDAAHHVVQRIEAMSKADSSGD